MGSIANLKKHFSTDKTYLLPLAVYTLLFLFFCSKLSPLYPNNEWGDINVYFNMGKGMFNGMTLYSEIFDHKGPLIFFLYGLGSLLSGSSFIGVFILFVLMWTTAIFATFYTAKLFLRDEFAFIVSLLFPIAANFYIHLGGSAEEIILLLIVISLYFFLRFFAENKSSHAPKWMFVHGVLSASALMIKLNLIVFWFFPLLAIFVYLLYKKEYKNFLQNALTYLGGFALILLPFILYFSINKSLHEAYNVYIELNRQYASSSDYAYLMSNGVRKLFTEYRDQLVWYLIITVGVCYFPFHFLKNKWGALSICLAGASLVLIIFFPLTYHHYYPLPLLAFATCGLLVLFHFLQQYLSIEWTRKLQYTILIILLLIPINRTDFFGLGGKNILRLEDPEGPQFAFKKTIEAEENATLLNLSFMEGNALFTTAGLTPTVKYFFCPNIYYEMYPDIRNSQAHYIENKETMFIINCSEGFNVEFFKNFAPLQQNYTLIDSYTLGSRHFDLYKRND